MSRDVDFLEQTDFDPFQSAVGAKSIMHFYAELQREAASFLGDKASLDAARHDIANAPGCRATSCRSLGGRATFQ